MNDTDDWCHFNNILSMPYGTSYNTLEPTNLVAVNNSFGITAIAQAKTVNLYYNKTLLSSLQANKPLTTFAFEESVYFLSLSKDCSLLAVGQKTQLSLINLKNNEKSQIKLESFIRNLEFKNNKLGLLQANNKFDLYESDKSLNKLKNVDSFTFAGNSKHIIIAQEMQIKKISLDSMNQIIQCPFEFPILSLKENLGQVFAYSLYESQVHILIFNSNLEQIEDITDVSLIDDGVDPALLNDPKKIKVFFEFIDKRTNMVFTSSASPSIELITLNASPGLVNFEENYEGHGYLGKIQGSSYLNVFKGFGLIWSEHDAEVGSFEYSGEVYEINKPPIVVSLDNEGTLNVFAVVDLRTEYLNIESCVEAQYQFNLFVEADKKSSVEENKREEGLVAGTNSSISQGLMGSGNINDNNFKGSADSKPGANIFTGLLSSTDFSKPQAPSLNTEKNQVNLFAVNIGENSLGKQSIFGQPTLTNQNVFGASSKPPVNSDGPGSVPNTFFSGPQTSANLTQTETGGSKTGFFVKPEEKNDKKSGGWMNSAQVKLPENFKLPNTEEKKAEISGFGISSGNNSMFGNKEVKNESEKIDKKPDLFAGGAGKADSQGVSNAESGKAEKMTGLFSAMNVEPATKVNPFGNSDLKVAQNVDSKVGELKSGLFNASISGSGASLFQVGKTESQPFKIPESAPKGLFSSSNLVQGSGSFQLGKTDISGSKNNESEKQNIFNPSKTEPASNFFHFGKTESQPFKSLDSEQKGLFSFSNTMQGIGSTQFGKSETPGVKTNEIEKPTIFNVPKPEPASSLFQSVKPEMQPFKSLESEPKSLFNSSNPVQGAGSFQLGKTDISGSKNNESEKQNSISTSNTGPSSGFFQSGKTEIQPFKSLESEQKGFFSFSNSLQGIGSTQFGKSDTPGVKTNEIEKPTIFNVSKPELASSIFQLGNPNNQPFKAFEFDQNRVFNSPNTFQGPESLQFGKTDAKLFKANESEKPNAFNTPNAGPGSNPFQFGNTTSQPIKAFEVDQNRLFNSPNTFQGPESLQFGKTDRQGVKATEVNKTEQKPEVFTNPATGLGSSLFQPGGSLFSSFNPEAHKNTNSELSSTNIKQTINVFSSSSQQSFSNFGSSFNAANTFLAPQHTSESEKAPFTHSTNNNFVQAPAIITNNPVLAQNTFNQRNFIQQSTENKTLLIEKKLERPLRLLKELKNTLDTFSDLYKSDYSQFNSRIYVAGEKVLKNIPEVFSVSQKNRDLTAQFTSLRKEIVQNKGNNFNSLLNTSFTKNAEIISNMEKQLESLRATTSSLNSLIPVQYNKASQDNSIKAASILSERKNVFATKLESIREKLLTLNLLAKSSNPEVYSLWPEHSYNFIDPKEYKSLYASIVLQTRPSQSSQFSEKKSTQLSYKPIRMNLNLSDLNIQHDPIRKTVQNTSFIQNIKKQQENLLKEIQNYQAIQGKTQPNDPNSPGLVENTQKKEDKVPQILQNNEKVPQTAPKPSGLTEIKPQITSSNPVSSAPKPSMPEVRPSEVSNPAVSQSNPFSRTNPSSSSNPPQPTNPLPPSASLPSSNPPVSSAPANSFFVNKPPATSSSLSQISAPLSNNPFNNSGLPQMSPSLASNAFNAPGLAQNPASLASSAFNAPGLSATPGSLASNPFASAGFGQQSSFVSPSIPKMDGIANKNFGVSSNPFSGFASAVSNPQPHEQNRSDSSSFFKPRK